MLSQKMNCLYWKFINQMNDNNHGVNISRMRRKAANSKLHVLIKVERYVVILIILFKIYSEVQINTKLYNFINILNTEIRLKCYCNSYIQ